MPGGHAEAAYRRNQSGCAATLPHPTLEEGSQISSLETALPSLGPTRSIGDRPPSPQRRIEASLTPRYAAAPPPYLANLAILAYPS